MGIYMLMLYVAFDLHGQFDFMFIEQYVTSQIVIFGIAISHHLLEIVINENRMLSRKHIHFKYSLPNVCESNENLSLKN